MSDPGSVEAVSAAESPGLTAGAMLRAARDQRGLHIAALAAAIKVPQRKLEALESDRYEELLDLTFTRALAQTVCRTLKIDAQPVLDRLPQPEGSAPKLAHVSSGLNAPFRERPGREEPADWGWMGRPVIWGTLIVLIGAALLAWMPERFLGRLRGVLPVAPSASAAASSPALPLQPVFPASAVTGSQPAESGVTAAGEGVAATSLGAPAVVVVPETSVPIATVAVGSALLGLKASSESWVEVQDSRGQTLLSRRIAAGESLGLDGAVPLRLTIGNAAGTQVTFRGRVVDTSANTVANVARLQLD